MNRSVYMDNGATSFPKAPGVAEAMNRYITEVGSSVNRGAYDSAFSAENVVFETREKIAELFNFDKPENVVFTKNITESLNVLIKGLLIAGDHVVVSSVEHNAVMRPLMALKKRGVDFSRAACDDEGNLDIEDFKRQIKENTKAVIMTHGSNVSGTILDLESVGVVCREKGIPFIVDAAQTAGFLNIDMQRIGADAIAFTGHKSLLGPQGTGGFAIRDSLVERVSTFIEGGTGSLSEMEEQPTYMPDKFESGTPNVVGIFGLHAALCHIEKTGVEKIAMRELEMTGHFIDGLLEIPEARLAGRKDLLKRTAVVSIDFEGRDNALIAHELSKRYGISTRCGLHCAPAAHKTLGTFPQGTVRFSLGYWATMEEVDYALKSIKEVLKLF
ncbi:MAG: aminotransferase class V-fold PLP-dependent enzyme [Peptostreptococcaceae bacterium]|nr:aminotransferase class V-fold PLP-dependent enzyme [Peptostreptococcaceae bacterium]